jgi:aspartate-semialdehyde dehydrogenase
MPAWAAGMLVQPSLPPPDVRVAFSALPGEKSREIEAECARSGIAVCSNASAYRADADVPIILPEVNPDHAALIEAQRRLRGWRGSIVCNSNCTITGVTIVLHALRRAFGVQNAFVVSLQAVSGAGYPGVGSASLSKSWGFCAPNAWNPLLSPCLHTPIASRW